MNHTPAAAVAPHLKPGRKATWFELFFDLAFVTAVAQLTATLSQHPDGAGFARFVLLLLVLWWTWLGHTFHATRFDEDRPDQRLIGMGKVAAVMVVAFGAGAAFGERALVFALGMAALKALLMLDYLRERSHPAARGLAGVYATVYGVQTLLWLASAALAGETQWALWAAVLLLDIATPTLVARHTHGFPPHPAHLPERFGLFTIIVMGEGVASTLHALLHAEHPSPATWALAALGLALAFQYWTGYFDRVGGHHDLHVRNAAEGARLRRWAFGHVPLLVGIAGGAAALIAAAGHAAEPAAPWVAGICIALAMTGLTLIGAARSDEPAALHGRRHHLLLAGVPVAAAAAGSVFGVFVAGVLVSGLQLRLARR
jgi:low temperature requirement protein LtrA